MSETEVSWRAAPDRGEVVDADGKQLGFVESVLGDVDDDIFHGLAVRLVPSNRLVELTADRVQRITPERIYTSVRGDEAETLPEYEESKWFRVRWSGGHDDPTWKPSGEA